MVTLSHVSEIIPRIVILCRRGTKNYRQILCQCRQLHDLKSLLTLPETEIVYTLTITTKPFTGNKVLKCLFFVWFSSKGQWCSGIRGWYAVIMFSLLKLPKSVLSTWRFWRLPRIYEWLLANEVNTDYWVLHMMPFWAVRNHCKRLTRRCFSGENPAGDHVWNCHARCHSSGVNLFIFFRLTFGVEIFF